MGIEYCEPSPGLVEHGVLLGKHLEENGLGHVSDVLGIGRAPLGIGPVAWLPEIVVHLLVPLERVGLRESVTARLSGLAGLIKVADKGSGPMNCVSVVSLTGAPNTTFNTIIPCGF